MLEWKHEKDTTSLSVAHTELEVFEHDEYYIYYDIEDRRKTNDKCFKVYIMYTLYDEEGYHTYKDTNTLEDAINIANEHYELLRECEQDKELYEKQIYTFSHIIQIKSSPLMLETINVSN